MLGEKVVVVVVHTIQKVSRSIPKDLRSKSKQTKSQQKSMLKKISLPTNAYMST